MNIEDYFKQHELVHGTDPWESVECRQYDPEMWWFIDDIHGVVSNELAELAGEALKICERCEMKLECLQLGLEDENYKWGIWGGTFAGERYAMLGHNRYTHEKQQIGKAQRLRARIEKQMKEGHDETND